jgi:hypothetical protein
MIWMSIKLVYNVADRITADTAVRLQLAITILLPLFAQVTCIVVFAVLMAALSQPESRAEAVSRLQVPFAVTLTFAVLLGISAIPFVWTEDVEAFAATFGESGGLPAQLFVAGSFVAWVWLCAFLWLVAFAAPLHNFRAVDGHLWLAPMVAASTAWLVNFVAPSVHALTPDDILLPEAHNLSPIANIIKYAGPVTITGLALAEIWHLKREFGANMRTTALQPRVGFQNPTMGADLRR